jgi:hypothetical protein
MLGKAFVYLAIQCCRQVGCSSGIAHSDEILDEKCSIQLGIDLVLYRHSVCASKVAISCWGGGAIAWATRYGRKDRHVSIAHSVGWQQSQAIVDAARAAERAPSTPPAA